LSLINIPVILQNQFSENWWEKYEFNDGDFSVAGINRLSTDLVDVKENIFNELNASVLTGEYIALDSFVEQVKKLKESINSLPVPFTTSDNSQEVVNKDLNINFTDALKAAITYYIDFVKWLKVKIRGNASETFLINDELDDLFEEKEYEKVTERHILFFIANIAIARFDHALTPSEEDFSRLIAFSRDLLRSPRYRGNIYAILLQSKSKFLICKWLVRKSQAKGPMYAVINSIEREFEITDYKEQLFLEWINYLENHYEINSHWKARITKSIASFRNKKLADLSFLQLHALTKFYKDIQPNFTQITAIKNEVALRYEDAKSNNDEYHQFVCSIALNYLAGNEFSLLLDNASVTDGEVHLAYQNVLNIQTATGIYNFFPQFKYVEFIKKKLDAYPKTLTMLNDLEIQRRYIETCKTIFKTYVEHVDWSRKNYNYVFYLPVEESTLVIDNGQLTKLYIASTFVMPLYKKDYIEAFEKFKKEIDATETAIITFENIQGELLKLRTAQQDIENREIKSIETLSIFTTIVTFVFASVVEFKFITQPSQAILFTICLSTSLAIFVFLIVLLRSNSFIVTVRRYFAWILAGFIFASMLWFLINYAPYVKTYLTSRKTQPVAPLTQPSKETEPLNDAQKPAIKGHE